MTDHDNNNNNTTTSSYYQPYQEASADNPWAIGTIGALPSHLVKLVPSCGVRHGPWSAWLLSSSSSDNDDDDDNGNAWQVYACYTNSQLDLKQQKFKTAVTKIVIENDDDYDNAAPLLALQHASGGGTSTAGPVAYVYVCLPTRGEIRGYTITAHGTTPVGRAMQTFLPGEEGAVGVVTALVPATGSLGKKHHAAAAALYAATNTGRIFRIQPRLATNSMLCHDVTATLPQQAAGGAATSLFRFFAGGASTTAQAAVWKFQAIQSLVPAVLSSSTTTTTRLGFWTVTTAGIQLWQTTINANTAGTPTATSVVPLKMEFDLSITPLSSSSHKHLPRGFQVQDVAQATPTTVYVLGTVSTGTAKHNAGWYAVRWVRRCRRNPDNGDGTWYVVAAVTWLNRLSVTATCLGWQASQNGMAWGAFVPQNSSVVPENVRESSTAHPDIVVAVVPTTAVNENDDDDNDDDEEEEPPADHVYEYECEPEDHMLPGSFQADYATHGVTFANKSGTLMRAQVKGVTIAETLTTNQRRSATWNHAETRRYEATLLSHLRSTFQAYFRTSDPPSAAMVELPPSWNTPETGLVRDQVVATLGLEHLPQNSQGSQSSVLHRAYIDFLREIGLYRSLKAITKWQLFAMGQEIDAYENLPLVDLPEQHAPQSASLALWMEAYQSKIVLQPVEGALTPEKLDAWTKRLAASLGSAMQFRLDQESVTYDLGSMPVVKKREEVPLWLARPALVKTLQAFVDFWSHEKPESISPFVRSNKMVTVLLAALESTGAAFVALPHDRAVRREYAGMQEAVMNLLCRGEMHDLAWDLSQKHCYFAGLCDLAKENEKEPETQFQLKPLFEKLGTNQDVGTGLSFGAFVLKWHVDRKLYGHALRYGVDCPSDLQRLVESDPSFGKYRWIVAIRRGDYEDAALSLIQNTNPTSTTVEQTKINMGLAKMANSLVTMNQDAHAIRGGAAQQEKMIEKLRERANAQEELFGETEESRSKPLKSADELLRYAFTLLDRQESTDAKVKTCYHALAVCTTFETMEQTRNGAIRVWLEALQHDLLLLKQRVLGVAKIDLDFVHEKTVLGALYSEVSTSAPEWVDVKLDGYVGKGMLENLAPEDRPGVSRLFHCLSAQ